jgi:hypothetical protein
MSENPPSGPLHGHGTSGFPSAPTGFQPGPPAWQPAPTKGQSRGLTYVSLAVALIATVLAIVGWFRPTPPPPAPHAAAPTYTEQQIADAKTKACGAFELVDKGVVLQTGGGNPRPEPSNDPVMAEARAADARLSLVAGSMYLRDHLNPATAPNLASAVRNYATILANLAQNYLAGIKDADPAQESLLKDSDAAFAQLHEMCQ